MALPNDHQIQVYREEARRLLPHYRHMLAELVAQRSIPDDPDGLMACALSLRDIMRSAGIDATLFPSGSAPIVFGRYRPVPADQDRPGLLIYGHYDVQPAGDAACWSHPPYTLTEESGHLYGRGTADDKGQILCHIAALQLLRARGEQPSADLVFLFEGGGETGSPDLAEFAASHRELLSAAVAFSADGPRRGLAPNLYLGARGLLSLDLEIKTAQRDRHAGDYAGMWTNPAREMARLINNLVGDRGECLIPGFHRNVREPLATEQRLMERLPPPRDLDSGLSPVDAYRRLLFHPVCNVSSISTGDADPGGRGTVPGAARAQLELRLVPDQDPARILGLVHAFLRARAPGVDVRVLASIPPSRTDPDLPEVARMADILRVTFAADPSIYPMMTGIAPDHVFTRILGIPSLWVPYADWDRASHAPDEHLRVSSAISGIVTSAAVFTGLLHQIPSMEEG